MTPDLVVFARPELYLLMLACVSFGALLIATIWAASTAWRNYHTATGSEEYE